MASPPGVTSGARLRARRTTSRLTAALLLASAAVATLPVQAETASRVVWQGRWGFNDQSPAANHVTSNRADAFQFIQNRMDYHMRISYGRCAPPTITYEGDHDRTAGSGLLYAGWPTWNIQYVDGAICTSSGAANTSGELFSYVQTFDPGPVEEKSCSTDNPVQPGTGRKLFKETDYSGAGADALNLRRFYRSRWMDGQAARGAAPLTAWDGGWRLSVQASVTLRADGSLRAFRPDGSTEGFGPRGAATAWTATTSRDTVTPIVDAGGQVTGFTYSSVSDDSTETYDATGRLQTVRARNGWLTSLAYSDASTPTTVAPAPGLLISVRNAFGREIRFTYDAASRIAEVLPPGAVSGAAAGASSPIRYNYEEAASRGTTVPALGQLTSVTWQDGAVRRYHYEDGRWPQALTGITDEAGVRYATYAYDSNGRVVRTERAGGVDRVEYGYALDTGGSPTTTVTDYSGPGGAATSRTYSFLDIDGVRYATQVTAPCPLCGNTRQASSYDAAGRLVKAIDHDGTVTFYAYNAKGNETERASFPASYSGATTRPALSAATKVVSAKWHGSFNLPTQVAEPGRITATTYNSKGMTTGESWTATTDSTGRNKFSAAKTGSTYATGWAYNASSLATSIVTRETPAGATTATEMGRWTLAYNALGAVTSVTDVTRGNLVGRATQYDVHGHMLAGTTDAGVALGFSYAPRGFYATKAVGGQTVTFAQNPIGLTTEVRTPDNQVLGYVYDTAHRLTDVTLNGASITPAMLAKAEYPDTIAKATLERARVLLRESIEALLPSAFAQVPMPPGGLRPVLVLPGQPMPGQPEFDPRTDLMTMAPMSASDKAARNLAERWARLCECKPEGGYERPTFTAVTFAHVLFSGHLSPSFSDKSYFAPTEAVGQTLVDEVMAHGQEVPSGDPNRVVVAAVLTRPLGSVGYARTSTGAFVSTNKVRLVYERTHCSSRFRGRNEVVTIYPE